MNIDAIIALSIGTAFLRSGFDNKTSAHEVNKLDAWEEIADLAIGNLKWVGVDTKEIIIDEYAITESMWGIDESDDVLEDESQE